MAQHVAVMVQGRTVLLGDHTYVVKDARRMPGVVTLHQDSETQSTPPTFGGIIGASWDSWAGHWHRPGVSRLRPACIRAWPTDQMTLQTRPNGQPWR